MNNDITILRHIPNLTNEIWKTIKDFPNYKVSNKGRIQSNDMKLLCKNNTFRIRKGIVLKQSFDKDGYLRVALNGITKKSHRLVAEHFVDNPNNLPEINHDDLDKTNNEDYNLIWCTHKENFDHSTLNNAQATSETSNCSMKVLQLDLKGNIIKEFNSIREAEYITGISNATISKVCRGIGKTANGYKWKYK